MRPTPLGIALVDGLEAADASLVQPELRAGMEAAVTRIAEGERPKSLVVESLLESFKRKYTGVCERLHLITPRFVSLEAMHLLSQSVSRTSAGPSRQHEVSGRDFRSNVSLHHLKQLEERDETLAIVAHYSEQQRRVRDREQLVCELESVGHRNYHCKDNASLATELLHRLYF
mmetsp:Transcript_421/g.849  ORF Transcript_421/g.849 Transcript_421/m.849 type:complete len:173 (-) Transcript_421:20-538(-)